MTDDSRVPLCVTDPRDRILLAQTPLLPVPVFGTPPPTPHGLRQYLGAADGLYVHMRHQGLSAMGKIAETSLPYGSVSPGVCLPGGLIPHEIMQEIGRAVVAECPKEWAGWVHWDLGEQRYRLTVPRVVSHSGGHVSYDTSELGSERLVLHVHSHGTFPPFFSPVDDESDTAGCYFACVLGHCESLNTLRACLRFVLEGHVFAVDRPPWETASDHAERLVTARSSENITISLQSLGMLGPSHATDILSAK